MKSISLNTDERNRMNSVWQLYRQLQEAIQAIDIASSVNLVKEIHEILSLMSTGTSQERKMMMEFELQILPSYIQEICDLDETISSFIKGNNTENI